MRKLLLFVFVAGLLAGSPLSSSGGDEYTGSVSIPEYPEAFEDTQSFLRGMEGEIEGRILFTKETFEEVKDFYATDLSEEPVSEYEIAGGAGRRAFFVYDKWKPGYYFSTVAGVKINSGGGDGAYKLKDVFNTLSAESHKGNILRKEVEEIKEKYAHLEHAYFPRVYDEENETHICKSRFLYNEIFNPEERQRREADTEAYYENLEQEMQDAMASGNMHKMQEIAMKMQQASQGQVDDFYSGDDIEPSREWLEKVDEIGYRTRIEISNHFVIEE